MRHSLRPLILTLLAGCLSSCSDEAARGRFCPPEPEPCDSADIEVEARTIGPDGGEIRIDGVSLLVIPPGALSEEVRIELGSLLPRFLAYPAGTFDDLSDGEAQREPLRPTAELRIVSGAFLTPADLVLAKPALLILDTPATTPDPHPLVGVEFERVYGGARTEHRWIRTHHQTGTLAPRALLGAFADGDAAVLIDRFPPDQTPLGLAEPAETFIDVYPTGATPSHCAGLDYQGPVETPDAAPPLADGWPAGCAERPDTCRALALLLDSPQRDAWLAALMPQLDRVAEVAGQRPSAAAIHRALTDDLLYVWGIVSPASRDGTLCDRDPSTLSYREETWCALGELPADATAAFGPALDPLDGELLAAWLIDRAERQVRLRRIPAAFARPLHPTQAPHTFLALLRQDGWLALGAPPPEPGNGVARWSSRWRARLPVTNDRIGERAGDRATFDRRLGGGPAPLELRATRAVRCVLSPLAAALPGSAQTNDTIIDDPDAARVRAETVWRARALLYGAWTTDDPRLALLDPLLETRQRMAPSEAWQVVVATAFETIASIIDARFCCVGGLDAPLPDGAEPTDCPAPLDLSPNQSQADPERPSTMGWLQHHCMYSDDLVGFDVQVAPLDAGDLDGHCVATPADCETLTLSLDPTNPGAPGALLPLAERDDGARRYEWRPEAALWRRLSADGFRWRVRARTHLRLPHVWSEAATLNALRAPSPGEVACGDQDADICVGEEQIARCGRPAPRVEDCDAGSRCSTVDGDARCRPDDEIEPPDGGLGHPLAGGGADRDPDPNIARFACRPGDPVLAVVDGVVVAGDAPGDICLLDERGTRYCTRRLDGEPLPLACVVERGAIVGLCLDGFIELRAAPVDAAGEPAQPRPLPPVDRWSPPPVDPRPASCEDPAIAEACDGLDEDGDGRVDEVAAGVPLQRLCPVRCGVFAIDCSGGAWPDGDAFAEACACPPLNDRCVDAVEIAGPEALGPESEPLLIEVEGTTRHGRDDAQSFDPNCGSGSGAEVFYRFDLDIATRVDVQARGDDWFPQIYVRHDGCGAAVALECNVDASAPSLAVDLEPGSYLLVVDGDEDADGPFEAFLSFDPIGCEPRDYIYDDDGTLVPCEEPMPEDGIGICRRGVQRCADNGRDRDCVERVWPERDDGCDGLDNDCDGMVDEDGVPCDIDDIGDEDLGGGPPPDRCDRLRDADRCDAECPCADPNAMCLGGGCVIPPVCNVCGQDCDCSADCPCPGGEGCVNGQCVADQCSDHVCGSEPGVLVCTCSGPSGCHCPGGDTCVDDRCCTRQPASIYCEGNDIVTDDGCTAQRTSCEGGGCSGGRCQIVVPPVREELYYCNLPHPADVNVFTEISNCEEHADHQLGFYNGPAGGSFWTWGGNCPDLDDRENPDVPYTMTHFDNWVSHNARWRFTPEVDGRYQIYAAVPHENEVCPNFRGQYSSFPYAIFEGAVAGDPMRDVYFPQGEHRGSDGLLFEVDLVGGRTYVIVVYDQHNQGAGCIPCDARNRQVNFGSVKLFVDELRIRWTPQ